MIREKKTNKTNKCVYKKKKQIINSKSNGLHSLLRYHYLFINVYLKQKTSS